LNQRPGGDTARLVRARLFAIFMLCLTGSAAVVWRAPSLDVGIGLMLAIQVVAAVLVWRLLARAVAEVPDPVEQAVETERLATVLAAAKNGDLTLRTQIRAGALGSIGLGVDELLDAFATLINKVGAAASEVSGDAESIERFSRVLAERSNRQSTAIAEVARKLKGMGARSEEIGQIVELLEDVAAETNVLALNAALEASRAGAQGKGFGMVADEVRKLAERSAAATKDIGAFIQGIGATTDDTTRSVEEIRGLTEGVVTSASQTATAAAGLLSAARSLSQTLIRLRVPGQDETDLARALRERRSEIARALEPLAPLLESARTPLGEALREVLIVLTEGTSRPALRSATNIPTVASTSESSERLVPPSERTG
jgi:methyl-accepting chemotaxis protein